MTSGPSPKINRSTRRYQGRTFGLVTENITLPGGVTVDMDLIRHPGAAAMVPITADGRVVLIRQYRHAVGQTIWEIPAGTLDPGESPLACARRELVEETGFSASRWVELGAITPVPGYSDERVHLFLAFDLEQAQQNLDPDEILDVHETRLAEAVDMIFSRVIEDAKTIVGLLMAARWLEHQPLPKTRKK